MTTMATPAQLTEARGWISDCQWADIADDSEVSDRQVVRGVQRHYAGGWIGFLADTAGL